MASRIAGKFREIISEVTGDSRSDYLNSLRDEHKDELLQGRKAYAIDNGGNDITLFVPWKLHRPVDVLFNSIAVDSRVTPSAFKKLIDDANLFPKYTNARKKDDIVDYIISRVETSESLGFEEFLHGLFLIAKYRASVLRVTEQCAFNHMLTILVNHSNRIVQQQESEKQVQRNSSIPESLDGKSNSTSASHDGGVESLSHSESGKVATSPVNSVKTEDTPQKSPSQTILDDEMDKDADTEQNEDAKTVQETVFIEAAKVSRVSVGTETPFEREEVDDRIFRRAEDKMNETCELLKNELLSMREQLDDYKIQERHRQELLHKVSVLETGKEKMEKLMAKKDASAKEMEEKLNATIKDLSEELETIKETAGQLEAQLEKANEQLKTEEDFRTHQQQVQTLIALQNDYETTLFSAFITYRDEELQGGEFVMSEDNCIAFCLDFGLDELQLPVGSSSDPPAKLAFKEVTKRTSTGKLTYALFKEFLLRLAEIVDPQSTQKRAFQLLVL
eukprot:XP_001612289.1 hypothetical protein [Babesia bovis T2Bo]